MSQPVLSIIIPSYQRGDLLAACLHSIEKTAQLSQLQVIVVDDASPEKSISHCASRYSWVTCILQGRRQGFCAAVNAGLRLAKAEVVQVLNDDTEVLPNWYPAAIKRFREDPTLGSVAPLVLCWNQPAVIDSAGDGYDHGGYAYSHGKGHLLTSKWLQARDVQSASACAAFYRRTALLKVGGFPEEFVAYFDDLEVGLKLGKTGYRCVYEPECRVLHHGSASHRTVPRRQLTQQIACNEERLFCRHASCGRHWLRHGGIICMKALRRMREGMLVPFLLGRSKAWWEHFIVARPRPMAANQSTGLP